MKDHAGAFEAYTVAKPVVIASKTIKPVFRYLTLLHGAQSANKSKQYAEAIEFLNPLLDDDEAPLSIKQDAHLELGVAHSGRNNDELAIRNWEIAASNPGKTGAHARCMIGDLHFKNKQFDEAVTQYKITYFGYGGTAAPSEVKSWQAYAAYEAARCRTVQMGQAPSEPLKEQYRQQAIKHFDYLAKNYPEDKLAEEANRQLRRLQGNNDN